MPGNVTMLKLNISNPWNKEAETESCVQSRGIKSIAQHSCCSEYWNSGQPKAATLQEFLVHYWAFLKAELPCHFAAPLWISGLACHPVAQYNFSLLGPAVKHLLKSACNFWRTLQLCLYNKKICNYLILETVQLGHSPKLGINTTLLLNKGFKRIAYIYVRLKSFA